MLFGLFLVTQPNRQDGCHPVRTGVSKKSCRTAGKEQLIPKDGHILLSELKTVHAVKFYD